MLSSAAGDLSFVVVPKWHVSWELQHYNFCAAMYPRALFVHFCANNIS